MNENIVNAVCIAVIFVNAIWAYALWQIKLSGKQTKKVSAATSEVLANRIADLTKKIDALQNEVEHLRANSFGWKWMETFPNKDSEKNGQRSE